MRLWIGVPALLAALLLSSNARGDALDEQVARVVDRETMHFVAEASRGRFERFRRSVTLGPASHFVAEVSRRGLERVRRSVTLGPTFGVAPALTIDGDAERDVQISGGVALLRYDISALPTPEQIRAMLSSALTSAVVAQVRAAAERGQVPSGEEQRRLVDETWQRLKDELLRGHPRHLEKPRFLLLGEVAYLTSAEAWDVRVLMGLGFWRVFVAAGASLQYDGEPELVVPVELSIPVLVSDGPRSPVAQIFVRADVAVTGGDERPDRGFVGVRFALDVL